VDQAKLGKILRICFPVAIFFVCGVLGFSSKNVSSPVLKTVELMATISTFGYLVYRLAPKLDRGTELLSLKDLFIASILFVCTVICTFIVTERWTPIKGFELSGLCYCLIFTSRIANRLEGGVAQSLWKGLAFGVILIGPGLIFKNKIELSTIIGFLVMFPIVAYIDAMARKEGKSEPSISQIEQQYLNRNVPGGERLEPRVNTD